MQDALIPGIVMAAISALAFIAYRHPNAYKSFYLVFMGILFMSFAAYAYFHVGYSFGFDQSKLETVKLNASHISGLILPEDHSASFAPVAYFMGAQIYLIILRALPYILKLPASSNAK